MTTNPGFQKFRNAILENLLNFNENDEYCDLEVHCSDGVVLVHGLVFGTICPPVKSLSSSSLGDFCILLPDVSSTKLLVFLRCLFNGKLKEINFNTLEVLKEVADILGTLNGLTQLHCVVQDVTSSIEDNCISLKDTDTDTSGDVHIIELDSTVHPVINVENCTKMLNANEEVNHQYLGFSDSDSDLDKKCLLNLAAVDLDKVTDDILTENFSDQDGRLVCLVCYKILSPSDFKSYRSHMKEHDVSQLEKVTIILPDIGRGGPGLKKKFLSDFELENMYKDKSGTFLVCNKCNRKTPVTEKSSFRKHLTYHTHKEKNYLYQCPKCTIVFSDPSNLKRHVQSIHEKQVFRCLHCDFEDNRKKRLEDHLINAHSDKVGGEELSLDKGGGSEAIADLSANESSLPSFNSTESDTNVFLTPKAPSLQQKYSYQCTGCKFRKRKLSAVENHVKDCHSQTPDLPIKKIALKSKEIVNQTFACTFCSLSFKKRTLLNQHNFRVHEVQLDTEFACDQCGIRCANLPGLKAHARAHLIKRFLCGSCNKSFLVLSQLKDHVDKGVCLLENRQCSVCKKIFSGKHHLDLHMRLHTNTKPHPCNICEKSFTQKRSLKEHLLTHDTVRHFECKHCSKSFVQKNHLKYHVASQHFETDTEITKHQCHICGKVFPFPYQLKKHKKVHGNLTAKELLSQFQCSTCSIWFSSPALLNLHSETCLIKNKDPISIDKKDKDQSNNPNSGGTAIAVVLNKIEGPPVNIEEFNNIVWDQNEVIVESEDLKNGESLQLAVEQISGSNQYHLVNVAGMGNMVNYNVESEEVESYNAQLL